MYRREKIIELRRYLAEYKKMAPTAQEYKNNLKEKAAAERYFEKIVECAIDLGMIVVKQYKLERPENDEAIFETLTNHKLISRETADAMIVAKSMRNFIAHQYGKVEDEQVYFSLTKELPRDVEKFIKEIESIE